MSDGLVLKVYDCLDNNGILIQDNGALEDVDSIAFVSLVVDLENEFEISFPDEYLSIEKFSSVDDIVNLIKILIGES